MNRTQRALAALCATVTLTGCKTGIDLTLYTSDIITAAQGQTDLTAPGTLLIEAPSDEKCREAAPQIEEALRTGFDTASFDGCTRERFNTYARFNVTLPIIGPDAELQSALAIVAAPATGFSAVTVIKADAARIDAIITALPSDISNALSGRPEAAITATIRNDGTKPVTITAQGAFIAGEPYQLPHDTTLQRREEMTITLSDVGNAASWAGGSLIAKFND